MAKFYFDEDADLSALEGSLVGIIGYGNQGRSQALNLRDSGITPLIGNLDDAYAEQARKDGFDPRPIPEVAGRANAVFLLIPDEVQPQVYRDMIHAHLKPGNNATPINHFSILSTIESMYGLSKLGGAKKAAPITSAFSTTKI